MEAAWTAHVISIEGHPAGILVNTSLAPYAPVTTLPDLVMCHIPVSSTRESGLPSEEAFQAIYAFEERAMVLLPDCDDHVYVGHYADGTQAILHFYTRQAAKVIHALETDPELPGIARFGGRREDDPNWEIYLDILSPSEAAQNSNENNTVRLSMVAHGDDGTEPRPINHYAYFDDRSSRKAFMKTPSSEDFVVSDAPFFRREGKFALIFTHNGRPIDIDDVTLMLRQRAQEVDGNYDGWESPIIRSTK